jgi:hypothetical protein
LSLSGAADQIAASASEKAAAQKMAISDRFAAQPSAAAQSDGPAASSTARNDIDTSTGFGASTCRKSGP